MTNLIPLFPRQPVPRLHVSLVGDGFFDLEKENPANFTLHVFYRDIHCPICKAQLREIESKLDGFDKRGVASGIVGHERARFADHGSLGIDAAAPGLRPRPRFRAPLGLVHFDGARDDIDTRRRARALVGASYLSDTAEWRPVFRQRSNHGE